MVPAPVSRSAGRVYRHEQRSAGSSLSGELDADSIKEVRHGREDDGQQGREGSVESPT